MADGFGAFSVGQSQRLLVVNYILNQEEHHKKENIQRRIHKFLTAYQIDLNQNILSKITVSLYGAKNNGYNDY